jgi:hypothetical protein
MLDQVRGYANLFNEWSTPIGDDGIRALVLPGAFRLIGNGTTILIVRAACAQTLAADSVTMNAARQDKSRRHAFIRPPYLCRERSRVMSRGSDSFGRMRSKPGAGADATE